MFIAALSYIVVAFLQSRIEAGAQLSVLWQIVPYTVLTIAEVFVSTTGLEFAFREAAPQMKSLVMSFWLLTIALGDLLVAAVTRNFLQTGRNSIFLREHIPFSAIRRTDVCRRHSFQHRRSPLSLP